MNQVSLFVLKLKWTQLDWADKQLAPLAISGRVWIWIWIWVHVIALNGRGLINNRAALIGQAIGGLRDNSLRECKWVNFYCLSR